MQVQVHSDSRLVHSKLSFLQLVLLVANCWLWVALETSVSFWITLPQGKELVEGHRQQHTVLALPMWRNILAGFGEIWPDVFSQSKTLLPLGHDFWPAPAPVSPLQSKGTPSPWPSPGMGAGWEGLWTSWWSSLWNSDCPWKCYTLLIWPLSH